MPVEMICPSFITKHTGLWFASPPAALISKSYTAFCSIEQAVKTGACATLSCPGVFQALLQLGVTTSFFLMAGSTCL